MEISCPFCGLCQENIMHVFCFVYGHVRCGKKLDCGLLLVALKVDLLEIYLAGWMISEGQMTFSFLSYSAGACGSTAILWFIKE